MKEQKAKLREKMKKVRNSLTYDQVLAKSETIQSKVVSSGEFKRAKIIHCYVSFDNEVVTDEIIKKALEMGKKVVVPSQKSKEIKNYLISSLEAIENLQRIDDLSNFEDYEQIDLTLIPLLAFDNDGNRLGLGGGWYDRFLPQISKNAQKIGIAFDIQKTENNLPVEEHDIKLDKIITES